MTNSIIIINNDPHVHHVQHGAHHDLHDDVLRDDDGQVQSLQQDRLPQATCLVLRDDEVEEDHAEVHGDSVVAVVHNRVEAEHSVEVDTAGVDSTDDSELAVVVGVRIVEELVAVVERSIVVELVVVVVVEHSIDEERLLVADCMLVADRLEEPMVEGCCRRSNSIGLTW